MRYERENIQHLTAYTPGEQPAGAERVIKLNTNENPYPPIEPVMQAIRTLPAESLRKYPSPAALSFRRTAAQVHGLAPDQVIATNGGDELLRLAISVFCEPRTPVPARHGIGVADPSYSLYPILAATHGTPVVTVPLKTNYELPDDLEAKMLAAGVGLVLLVNPHAPSGTLTPLPRLEKLARSLMGHAVLLIDEAYVDFATQDALPLVRKESGLNNVLLLRTMSKGYSLAGLRFGYGLGSANLIAALDKARDSYNTDALAQAAATAALTNRALAAESWEKVIAQRTRMVNELTKRGWHVAPSQTNFLLAVPPKPDGESASRRAIAAASARLSGDAGVPFAKSIYEYLKARNILVRYFDLEGLRDKLRITIGTPDENTAVLEALDAM
jgi:histidinol-phosphate aminotransferase